VRDLVVFGARAFADIARYYFDHDSDHRVVAFTVDGQYLEESTFQGLPVVAFEEIERAFPPDRCSMFVAIGIQGVNRQRAARVDAAGARGYRLASFLSSKADVAPDLSLGPNTMVMERATLQPFVRLGRDTIVWSTSRIGFHTRVGDHCWVTCALIGESAAIGDYTFLGLNATVAPFVRVGESNVIGAGALILNDTRDGEVYRGRASRPSRVPSRRLREI